MLRHLVCRFPLARVGFQLLLRSHNTSYLKQTRFIQMSRALQQTSDIDSTQQKGITSKDDTAKDHKKDILMEQITKSNDMSSLLESTSRYYKIMNTTHLQMTFRMIANHIKSENISNDLVVNTSSFKALCDQTLRNIRFFSTQDTLTIFRTIRLLGLSLNCSLAQALLQMIRHAINDFDLPQLMFLSFQLQESENSRRIDPLLEAIRMALPLVFQTQLQYQLNTDDLDQLVSACSVALMHRLKPNYFEKAVECLLERNKDLSKVHILGLFNHLSHYPSKLSNESSLLAQLQKTLASRLTKKVSTLTQNEALNVIYCIERCGALHSSRLLTQLSHKAATEDWTLYSLEKLLRVFTRNGFVSTEILDLVAQKIQANPESLMNDSSLSVLNIVEAFSASDYVPGSSTEFLNVLLSCEDKIDELGRKAPYLLVKLVACFATMEAATPQLISKVMDHSFLNEVLNHKNPHVIRHSLQNYRLLEQVARIEMKGNYDGPFLPEDVLERAVRERSEVVKPVDIVLKEFLEIGLGGPQFVLNNLWTQYGHFIDHLIVMRKGDFPVSIGSKSEMVYPKTKNGLCYLEDIQVPPESKILTVMVARQEWFTKDPPRLSGWTSLQHRTLAKLGYNPIIVHPESWKGLYDKEKIPYIMREIKFVLKETQEQQEQPFLGMY